MIEEILRRLNAQNSILNSEFVLLCQHYNIKIGARTKGFINQYIIEICLEDNEFTIWCNHPDSHTDNYQLPIGIQNLFNDFYTLYSNSKGNM